MKRIRAIAAGAALAMSVGTAHAEITSVSEAGIGFAVAHKVQVEADPDTAFQMIRSPAKWWSGEHSWTGNADNFYMDAQAGGCFCELIPAEGGGPERSLRGSVQHMRILFSDGPKMIRLSGALGPLQGEALTGTMTITLTPIDRGTEIAFDYIVGGYMRFPIEQIAPAVDAVIGEQAMRLGAVLGPLAGGAPADAGPADAAEGAPEAGAERTDLGDIVGDLGEDPPSGPDQ